MVLTFPDALMRNEPMIGSKTDLAAWVFQLWAWGVGAFPLAAAVVKERYRHACLRKGHSIIDPRLGAKTFGRARPRFPAGATLTNEL
jgi:hypothetical protein